MNNEGAMCFGTIQKVHHLSARGFCFIVPDDGGADVFAHVRDFASPIDGLSAGRLATPIIATAWPASTEIDTPSSAWKSP
jgi:cold shock CspA family protein